MTPACLRILILARIHGKSRLLLHSRNGYAKPCRIWTGAQSKGGGRPRSGPYGSVHIPGYGSVRVHVAVAWASGLLKEPRVPQGMNLDHGCERTLCTEEDHYELVTSLINQKRRWTRRAERRAA